MSPSSPLSSSVSPRGILAAFLLFFTFPLLFAVYTRNVWEDYYITFRASKNLAIGQGLVFTPGEHIHSFTSPLGTLVPALCSLVAGPTHDDLALWLFRLISAVVLGGAGVLFYMALRKGLVATVPLWTGLVLLAEDPKTVMYSSNGMETAFMLFFLSLSVYALLVASPAPWKLLGLSWGGMMWSRPDGFIYAGAWAFACFVIDGGKTLGGNRAWLAGQFFRAGLLGLIIYLPWFAWAWSYYGSPIPHTIMAKGLNHHLTMAERLRGLFRRGTGGLFMPAYYGLGGWRNPGNWNPFFYGLGILFQLLVYLPLFLPRVSPLLRALSLTYLISLLYVACVIPIAFPWYIPCATWAGYLTVGLLLHYGVTRGFFRSPRILFLVAGILIACQTLVLLCVGEQIRNQQAIIETGQRKQIGLWLKDQAATPHDTVFLECLGYIGFYSNLKMYDFPGMSSDEMVQARRKLGTDDWLKLIRELRPDWLVLRQSEVGALDQQDSRLLSVEYEPRRTFDASAQVSALSIEGKNYLRADQTFIVYHRSP